MELDSEIKKRVEQEDWDSLASLAHSFELEIEKGDGETKKLQKELQIIRQVVHAYLSNERERKKFLSAKFLIGMHKTIEKLDKKITEHNYWRGEFLIFLRAILHKMKQEKLIVYKTLEKVNEFGKHKGFEDVL